MKPFRLSFDRKSRTSGAGTFFTGILWGGFAGFILPGSREDRFTRLAEILRGVKLDFEILQVAGNRHFLLGPPSSPLPKGRVTILTAHYDRAPGSPGANDNSVSVFLLIKTALELGSGEDKNWRIIFTDREELGEGEGLKDQGAYTLAGELRNRGLGSARIFVFDACGAGNGFIISTAAERLLKKESGSGADKTRNLVRSLRNRAMEIARNLGLETVFLLPTPFSDDAGFLSAGLPAQTITMLPTRKPRPWRRCSGKVPAWLAP